MGGRDHSCEVCGRGGFNDPDGSCVCPVDPAQPTDDGLRPAEGATASVGCGWCDGAGQVSAERNFLLARLLHGDYRWVGRSSTAMVLAAIGGQKPDAEPRDGWDLGRCIVTANVAPEHLREQMKPILDAWIDAMRQEKLPHYGVEEAFKMADEHTADVAALLGNAPAEVE